MKQGILLSGPPASGKDSVTAEMHRLAPDVILFPRLKVGRGRTAGYRPTSEEALDRLTEDGLIVQRHERYGNSYAVDRPHLEMLLAEGKIPVIHVGRVQNLAAFAELRSSFLSVLLWAGHDAVSHRLETRQDDRPTERLEAWAQERDDLLRIADPTLFDVALDTQTLSSLDAAQTILSILGGAAVSSALDPAGLIARVRHSGEA